MGFFGEKNYKYFMCFYDYKIKPLCIMLPKMSTYIKVMIVKLS